EAQTPDVAVRRPRQEPHFELSAGNAVDPVPFGHFPQRRYTRRGGNGDAVPKAPPPRRCLGILSEEGLGGGQKQGEPDGEERDPRVDVHGLPPLKSAGAKSGRAGAAAAPGSE